MKLFAPLVYPFALVKLVQLVVLSLELAYVQYFALLLESWRQSHQQALHLLRLFLLAEKAGKDDSTIVVSILLHGIALEFDNRHF